jgi:uncharacterized OB-fold protein
VNQDLERPTPVPDRVSLGFWTAAAAGRLCVQRCGSCGHHQYYGRALCVRCAGLDVEWVPVSGRGTVYSFTVIRRNAAPPWKTQVPYVVAVVEVEEGPRILSNIVGCEPSEVGIGAAVTVDFSQVKNGIAIPVFALSRE